MTGHARVGAPCKPLGFHQQRLVVAYPEEPERSTRLELVALPCGVTCNLPARAQATVARGIYLGVITLTDQLLQFAVFGLLSEQIGVEEDEQQAQSG